MHISIDVISLPREVERRRQIAEQMDQTGLPWRFVDAHAAPTSDLRMDRENWSKFNGRLLNERELACYSSHYAILKEVAHLGDREARIVFEDDAIIDVGFFRDIRTLQLLAENFSFLRFNGHLYASADEVCILGRRRVLRFRDRIFSCLGYMVDPKAARRLVDSLATVRRPVDVEVDRFWSHRVYCYCVYHLVAIERTSASGIGGREADPLGTRQWLEWKIQNQFEKLHRIWGNLVYSLQGDTEFCRIPYRGLVGRHVPMLDAVERPRATASNASRAEAAE